MKWLLILVLLRGGEPVNYVIGFGDSEAECRETRAEIYKQAKDGVKLWAECVQMRINEKQS